MIGARKGASAFAIAGAAWPALHALLHVGGWLQHGFPQQTDVVLSEGLGVVFVGALGAAMAWRRALRETEEMHA